MSFHVVAMLIPMEHLATMSVLADRFDPDVGGADSFNLSFSPTGLNPASHRGTQALLSGSGRLQILALNQGAALPPELVAGLEPQAARSAVDALALGDGIELCELAATHGLSLIANNGAD